MASTVHVTGSMTHIPTAAAVITAAAVPLAGWTVHTVVWHRRLAATRRDPLTVALRTEPGELGFRLGQLARVLAQPVTTGGHRVDVAVSVGAATPAMIGSRDLPALLRAADTAMYATKHTGRPLLAGPEHANAVSINGRRAGRPGTGNVPMGRAA
jgi:hypothetical protein